MATVKTFDELKIWIEARKLSLKVFYLARNEGFLKDFKFRDQIRAAAGSVMDNIAEGFERSGRLEFISFLAIAKGSCGEVISQLYRALDQEYITKSEFDELYNNYSTLAAQIAVFIRYLNNSKIKGTKFKNRIDLK